MRTLMINLMLVLSLISIAARADEELNLYELEPDTGTAPVLVISPEPEAQDVTAPAVPDVTPQQAGMGFVSAPWPTMPSVKDEDKGPNESLEIP